MTPELLEQILFVSYLIAGPLVWFLFGFGMFNGRSQMSLVKRPPTFVAQPLPRVTILIPAKDEGERIRACITSALEQDYPKFNVIAINDRSTDNTGAIMDEMARANPKLKVIHIRDGELREGWTGKCNALHTAVSHADGDFLLFMDSDVVIARDALSVTAARAAAHLYDVLSLLPKLESHTLWEGVLIPLASAGVLMMYAVALTNKEYIPNSAFANGQYLFIRRTVYDEMGGHERVKDKFCEDVEIARYLKPRGHKVKISWGTDFVAVRMYNSLASIFRGWSRSFYATSLGRPWRILAGIVFIFLSCYSVFVAAGWSVYRAMHPSSIQGIGESWQWLAVTAVHLGAMLFFIGVIYRWTGNRRRYAWLFPIGAGMMIGIFLKALRMCVTNKVEWRGTSYTHRMTPNVAEKV
jgi:chlorobactene glucosyltransferase